MKKLTDKEIKFVKETRFTPTVYQCDEYSKTPFENYDHAAKVAKAVYKIDLKKFLDKCLQDDDSDAISLEFAAAYLLSAFFSKGELEKMTPTEALDFLRDFKYHFGFRKWDENDARSALEEAYGIKIGERELYSQGGHMWNRGVSD